MQRFINRYCRFSFSALVDLIASNSKTPKIYPTPTENVPPTQIGYLISTNLHEFKTSQTLKEPAVTVVPPIQKISLIPSTNLHESKTPQTLKEPSVTAVPPIQEVPLMPSSSLHESKTPQTLKEPSVTAVPPIQEVSLIPSTSLHESKTPQTLKEPFVTAVPPIQEVPLMPSTSLQEQKSDILDTFERTVSHERMEFYKNCFHKLDTNKDGFITKEEFAEGLPIIYVTFDPESEGTKSVDQDETDEAVAANVLASKITDTRLKEL